MESPNEIQGSRFADARGKLHFFNTFDMTDVVRMYEISPSDTQTVRAWQGHQREKKWMYCNAGAFVVNLVKLNDIDQPAVNTSSEKFYLDAARPVILEIPGGYANGFKAVAEGSKLLVFSDFGLEDSKRDDFRYALDTWKVDWN